MRGRSRAEASSWHVWKLSEAEEKKKMCLHIYRSISVRLYMADAISERPKQSGGLELACVETQRSGREEENVLAYFPEHLCAFVYGGRHQ